MLQQWEASEPCNGIEVLSCNWLAVSVYRACQWTLCIGPGAAFWQGIAMAELRAAFAVLRVPRSEWELLAAQVRLMESAARPLLNARR